MSAYASPARRQAAASSARRVRAGAPAVPDRRRLAAEARPARLGRLVGRTSARSPGYAGAGRSEIDDEGIDPGFDAFNDLADYVDALASHLRAEAGRDDDHRDDFD